MATKPQTAAAFAATRAAQCHNARTDGATYWLHGHPIARREGNALILDWCGWYTTTTASHMNQILRAFGFTCRLSYATARDAGHSTHTFVQSPVTH
jgi:hypothetical protein